MSDDELDALLSRVAGGDVDALEGLYRELRVPVFAAALAVVGDRAAAEDLLHETFVRVWDKAGSYRPGTRPRAWVLAIARNLAIDVRRRRAREVAVEEPDARLDPSPGGLVDALSALTPVEREIVVLHVFAGLKHAEIAERLELPHGTVRWKYRAALERLAPLLGEDA